MKILFLAHVLPYPPVDGMRSTCYQIVRRISQRHEATLLCMAEPQEHKYLPELLNWCKQVEIIPHRVPRSGLRRLKNILLEKDPFCVRQFYSREYEKKLRFLIGQEKFDAVHLLSINMSGYAESLKGYPTLFFPHDSVSMQFRRNLPYEKNPIHWFYMFAQWRKMKNYEARILSQFRETVLVSEVDRKWVSELSPKASLSVIPAGVDCEYFKPKTDIAEKNPPSLLFRGVMNFPPNRDAVLYFYRQIWPLVKKEIPELTLTVVGKDPGKEILRLRDGVHTFVTGEVEDLRPYISQSTVNVCPMISGSGIKNKILEAWAMEKAVVATPLACDGVEAEHGKNIFIAPDPVSFSKYVIELVKNPSLREQIGKNGRELVKNKYNWESSISKFENLYRQISEKNMLV